MRNNYLKKIIIVLLAVVCLCALLAMGACKDKETKQYATLTLTAGDGGSISPATYEVEVGASVAEFVKDKKPTVSEGLTFFGWYEGDALLASDRTMPKGGLTLTAKYTVGYVAREYLQNIDGTYPETPTTREDVAIYGESFTYAPKTPHFSLDETQDNHLHSDSLGVGETFTAYLQRDYIQVVFAPNAPLGVEVEYIASKVVLYGTSVTFPQVNVQNDAEFCRFAGWATSVDGAVDYRPGDSVTPDPDGDVATYFARWEIAATDVFGGEDYVFLSLTEKDTVYLRRFGMEDKKGSYDPQNNVFVFQDDGNEVLSGRLLGSSFYYFKDTLEREYNAYGQTGEKLVLGAHGYAEYVGAKGAKHVGYYTVNEKTGDYVFESNAKSFTFRLVEGLGGLLFRIQGAEAGSYALVTNEYGVSYPLLILDGFGGLRYVGEDNEYRGYYLIDETAGDGVWYALILDGYSQAVEYFNFILTNEGNALGGYNGNVDGTYRVDDELGGSYSIFGGGNLTLDGYGSGTYNGATGRYEVEYNGWYQLQSGDLTLCENVFVRFTTAKGLVFGTFLKEGNDTYFYEIDRGALYGAYDFATTVTLDGLTYSNAFAYLYGNGQVSVWVPYGILNSGEGVYICIFSDGKWTERDDGYRIATDDGAYEIDVALRDGQLYVKDQGIRVDEGLTIDGFGDAWYYDRKVGYSYEPGVYYVYTFYIFEKDSVYVYMDGQFVAVNEIIVESDAHPNRGEYYLNMLYLDNGDVMVGLQTSREYYAYVLYGEADALEGSDGEFIFRATKNNATAAVLELYSQFRFRTGDGSKGDGIFEIFDKKLDSLGGILTTDGYGRGTYNGMTGAYYTSQNLLVFCADNGETYRLLVDENNGTVISTDDEAGTYVLFEGGELYNREYLYLDGQGNAIVYMLEWYAPTHTYTNEYILARGTYAEIDEYAVEGYVEYRVTVPQDTPYYGLIDGSFYVIAAREVDADGYEFAYFVIRENTQAGRFDVEGGGSIYSDGYNMDYATYTDPDGETYKGAMYLCDILDGNYDDRDYQPNVNGKNVLFVVADDGEATKELVFDILPSGKLSLRTQLYGAYAKVVEGTRTTAQLYLDGHGNAVLYDDVGAEICRGTVEKWTELEKDAWRFVDSNGGANNFFFRLYTVSQVGGAVYEYRVYTAEEDGVYVSAEEWWVLHLDGYGLARYIDHYGVVTEGRYGLVGGWLVILYPDALGAQPIYFSVTQEGSFSLIKDDFIVAEGALYAYNGNAKSVTLPGGVTVVKQGAFAHSSVEEVNLNKVTRLDGEAFVGSRVKAVAGGELVEIGERAFYGCTGLNSVNIPAVQTIGDEAFYGCTMLRTVVLCEIRQIGKNAFTHREAYNDTMTLDLLAVPDPNAIAIDATAFDGIADGETSGSIHLRILVGDIDTVNAIMNGNAWPEGVRRCGALRYDAETNGSYICFDNGKLYGLHGGYLSEMIAGGIDVAYGDAIGIYSTDGDNTVLYTLSADGRGYDTAPLTIGDIISAGGITLFATDASHTLLADDSRQFTFTLSYRYVQSSLGFRFAFSVQATLSGVEFDSIRYNAELRVFFAQLGEEFLQITVISDTQCALDNEGSETQLITEDGAYRVRLRLDEDGKPVELVSFEYLSNRGNWILRTVFDVEIRPDGSLFVSVVPEKPVYYVITYVKGDQTESVTVELYGETKNNAPVSGDSSTKATIVVKDGNIVDVKALTYKGETQEIVSVTANADGSATVTTANGVKYRITYTPNRFSDYVTVEIVQ